MLLIFYYESSRCLSPLFALTRAVIENQGHVVANYNLLTIRCNGCYCQSWFVGVLCCSCSSLVKWWRHFKKWSGCSELTSAQYVFYWRNCCCTVPEFCAVYYPCCFMHAIEENHSWFYVVWRLCHFISHQRVSPTVAKLCSIGPPWALVLAQFSWPEFTIAALRLVALIGIALYLWCLCFRWLPDT